MQSPGGNLDVDPVPGTRDPHPGKRGETEGGVCLFIKMRYLSLGCVSISPLFLFLLFPVLVRPDHSLSLLQACSSILVRKCDEKVDPGWPYFQVV